MSVADVARVHVRFYCFERREPAADSLFMGSAGTVVMQCAGFPIDFDDCTCIPKGPFGVWKKSGITKLDAQWYAKSEDLSRNDIPETVVGSPRIKGYICHQRRPDLNSYPLFSVHLDGKEVQMLAIIGEQMVFRRLAHQVQVDLKTVARDQRFTVTAEWGKGHVELRVTWLEDVDNIERGSGGGILAEEMDSYWRPQSGRVKQFTDRTDFGHEECAPEEKAVAGIRSEASMAEFATDVDRLTTEHLEVMARTLCKGPAAFRNYADLLTYGISTEVLRFFFGNKWTNENVFSVETDVSRHHRQGRRFLLTETEDEASQFRHMQRVASLAELTFNLQGVEGMRHRVRMMDKDNLEAALGELECAALVAHPNLKFRFVTPTNVKGQDYDGEVVTPGNQIVCCEIKSKSEKTEAGTSSLWTTLVKARKQLPRGRPGMILVRIPEQWIEPTIFRIVIDAVERLFRRTNRIVAVVVTWEEWHSVQELGKMMMKKWKPYMNKKSNLYGQDIEAMLQYLGELKNQTWVLFHDFVTGYLEGLARQGKNVRDS